eukprot:scaffold78982_cov26-Tisochrysis_lutea.AAC.3
MRGEAGTVGMRATRLFKRRDPASAAMAPMLTFGCCPSFVFIDGDQVKERTRSPSPAPAMDPPTAAAAGAAAGGDGGGLAMHAGGCTSVLTVVPPAGVSTRRLADRAGRRAAAGLARLS